MECQSPPGRSAPQSDGERLLDGDVAGGPAMSEEAKPVVFTIHARERCAMRGATEADVIKAIRDGKAEPAQRGLWSGCIA